ncbi:hypothetical protein N2152v2_006591 [Parachlorella kessleri]
MEPGETVTGYTARAKALQHQLTAAGAEVSDSQLAWRVLAGLSDKYSMTVEVLEEQRKGTVRPDEQALFASQSRGSQPGVQGSKAGVKCFKCGQYGHYKRECPELSNKKKQQQHSQGQDRIQQVVSHFAEMEMPL